MASFTLHQVTEILDGPAYRVTNEVTAMQDASLAVFVFKTSTQTFSHYAGAGDLEQWSDSFELASLAGAAYYRLPRVVRTWDTVALMQADLSMTLRRIQCLADELNTLQGSLTVDRITVVQGA